MKLTINNFKGIQNASINISDFTLVAGDNGAGKSSIAQALQAVITGQCPLSLKKTDYKQLINNSGEKIATIELVSNGSKSIIDFPACKPFTTGTPINSSIYGAGISSPVDNHKEWVDILQSKPTNEDLKTALSGYPYSHHFKDVVNYVTGLVKKLDYDGALKEIKEQGAIHKGRWSKITNTNYGTKIAENWQPDNLPFDTTLEQLENNLVELQKQYEENLKKTAISEHEKTELQNKANNLKINQETFVKAKKAHTEKVEYLKHYREEFTKAKTLYEEMNSQGKVHNCPHCKGELKIVQGNIVKNEVNPKLQYIDTIKEQFTKTGNEVLTCENETKKLERDITEIERLIEQSKQAQEQLTKLSNEQPDNTIAEKLHIAKLQLQAFKDYHEACKENGEVMWRIFVCKILEPDGLRKQVMNEAIQKMNKNLKVITDLAGWSTVNLDNDFNIYYNNRVYEILSESEQYRARAVIQAIIGMDDNSQVFVFDRADLLDKKGRNGLMKITKYLNQNNRVCVIFMTINIIENILNKVYSVWVKNGNVMTVEEFQLERLDFIRKNERMIQSDSELFAEYVKNSS
jgi:energy-coupling factor transporter ATP-binding protein EcfA2